MDGTFRYRNVSGTDEGSTSRPVHVADACAALIGTGAAGRMAVRKIVVKMIGRHAKNTRASATALLQV